MLWFNAPFRNKQLSSLLMMWVFLLSGSVRFPSPALLLPLFRKSYLHALPPLERSSDPSSLPVQLVEQQGPEGLQSPSLRRSKTPLRNISLALTYRRGWCTRGAWTEYMRTGEPRFVTLVSGTELTRNKKT